MITKTYEIVDDLLQKKKSIQYFSTISGSNTMAMLASFPIGQEILKSIVQRSSIPINIFSYTMAGRLRENVLTVLIEMMKYDLFNLLFNRILCDAPTVGPGNLPALGDALLYLQNQGNRGKDLLILYSNTCSFPSLFSSSSSSSSLKQLYI
jgi:hypothetical protein